MGDSPGRSVAFGPFRLFPSARVLEKDGARLALGSRALDILIVLVEHAGEVVGHKALTQRVWRGLVVTPSSLRVQLAKLRKVLGEDEAQPRYIANVPGQGYSFVAPVVREDADAPAPAEPAAAPPHNLPHQLTSFIGREQEIAQLGTQIAEQRLLTLTGAGGCGKTRLALQLAGEVLEDFPDGCWFAEFAPLSDPALVARTVANVLDVKEPASGSLAEAIAERVASKRMLLVLDNAEHLVEACAEMVDLLMRRCGVLQVLVTSREPLGLSGEATFRVPSLSVPATDAATREAVLACEAAQLFIDRARLHRSDFDVEPGNAGTLASICRRLDGIALAIELAAPRLRTMTLEELGERLDDRFGLLTGGHRTALPRQRTLRSMIDWSHDLLTAPEKTMLRRLAVFAGGLTADAAEAVCAGEDIARGEVHGLLASLTEKNILVADVSAGVTRFGMLETVRHYAAEKLHHSGEEGALRTRHLQYFMSLADALAASKGEEDARVVMARLDRELDNVRAALAWCDADAARAPLGLRMSGRLSFFWTVRGVFVEGKHWIERFLASAPAADDQDHAKALGTAGGLAYHVDDYAQSLALDGRALAIYRKLGLRDEAAGVVGNMAATEVNRGNYPRARELFEEALAIHLEVGASPRSTVLHYYNLGVLNCALDDFERARVVLEEGMPVAGEAGRFSTAMMQQQLAWVRHAQGRTDDACAMFVEALQVQREFDDRIGIAMTLYYMAMVWHDAGDVAGARDQAREALERQQAMGDRILMASTLEVVAGLALDIATPLDAARLWGAAQRVREDIGAPQELALKRRCDAQIARARLSLKDDASFDTAWNNGRAMGLEAAVRLAHTL